MDNQDLIGKTLGQYQILDELGRGGMAVVYKAWQPSLRRYVALKVLLPFLGGDPEFISRFQQEGIVAANLNHPHIVTIYEVGQQDGHIFIAMEYVEGTSLEQLVLDQGALPLDRTIRILRQVAEALDYAHKRRFLHRDIKPANILLAEDDRVVITDFGIAKALEGSGATARLTSTGTVLGTPAYMSPEQIQGLAVDHRSDLYAFGIVAYEMLSGQVPFDGTTTALLYAQVNNPPPAITRFAPGLPQHVEWTIARMLAKRPDERFVSASEFVEALVNDRNVAAVPAYGATAAPVFPVSPPQNGTAVMPVGVQPQSPGISGYQGYGSSTIPQSPSAGIPSAVPSYGVPPAPPWAVPAPAVQAPAKRKSKILWWILGGLLLLGILVTGGVILGAKIFLDGDIGQLLTGKTPVPVETEEIVTPVQILFVSDRDGNAEIYAMNLDGSDQRNLTLSPNGEYWPHWSPDRSRIVFHSYQAGDIGGNAEMYTMNADGSNRTRLTETDYSERFPSWSPDGEWLVFASDREGAFDIYIMRKDATDIRLVTGSPARDYYPKWAPDGQRIVFESDRDGNLEIYVVGIDGGALTNLTNNPARDTLAALSPDGNLIAFESDRSGQREIWIMDASGGNPQMLTTEGGRQPRWSPDSSRIVFFSQRDGSNQIYVMNKDGSDQIRLTSEGNNSDPCW